MTAPPTPSTRQRARRPARRAPRRSRGRSGRRRWPPRRAPRRGRRRAAPRPRSPAARPAPMRSCVYDGPSSIPSAPTAARRRRARARRSHVAGQDVGERDAERGRVGDDPVGDRERREALPPIEKPTTVTSGPSTSSSTSARPLRAALRAVSIAAGSSAGSSTSVRPFCPCRSGAFTTTGPVTAGSSSSPPTTHERGCGTPASASRSRWRSLFVAATAVAGVIGCGRPSRSAIRAATPTGQSVPGEIDPVDAERAGEPLDRRLVLGREDAAAVGEVGSRARPGRGRRRRARGRAARRFEQPELCGAGA